MKKKIILTLLIYFGSYLTINYAMDSGNPMTNDRVNVNYYKTQTIYADEIVYKDVVGTVYHAVPEQTDDTPFITADNSFIDTAIVNDLRWIAISRDLVKLKTSRYNFKGKLKLGDTVWISYDKLSVLKQANERKISPEKLLKKYDQIVGWWVIKDTMGDYYWQPQKKIKVSEMTAEMLSSKEYKIKNGIVHKKHYQRNWIDFLQHPKTGMLDYWNKCIIITKKKVVGHNTELMMNG